MIKVNFKKFSIPITLAAALLIAVVGIRSDSCVPFIKNNVLFSILWGILLVSGCVNMFFADKYCRENDSSEISATSFYLELMASFLWCMMFFVYKNYTFAECIGIILLAVSNITTVLSSRCGRIYGIAMLLLELWAVFLIFISTYMLL